MGWGDSLMACGEAKELHEKTGQKVMIGDGKLIQHEPEIFANNPFVKANC